ncbi:hypothetical protein BvCmsKKP048_03018 [Escherichia coli]|nr:hypothetical protein BvCmsKKP048_03018 [Escherichia coli]
MFSIICNIINKKIIVFTLKFVFYYHLIRACRVRTQHKGAVTGCQVINCQRGEFIITAEYRQGFAGFEGIKPGISRHTPYGINH